MTASLLRCTFQTADPTPPAVISTPPTVIEITPLAGAIDVEPDTAVQVIFDRPLLVGGQATTFALEGPAGPVASTLRWVPADERPDPLVEGRGMNTAGRSQAFVGLDLRPRRALSTPREWATSPSRAMGTSTAGGDDTLCL
jgi:hypothetical protein